MLEVVLLITDYSIDYSFFTDYPNTSAMKRYPR